MIRINLAKKRKQGGGLDLKNLSLSSLLGALKSGTEDEDGQRKKLDFNNPLVKIVVGLLAIYLIDDTLTSYREQAMKAVDAQLAEVEKEREGVAAKLRKIKGFEPIKKQLEEDETAIRTKLEVVTRLLEDRNAPSKLMMQVAQAIPQEVWLTSLMVSPESVKFSGGTPSHNQVSDFIRSLSSTSYFGEVTLKGIQESTSAKGDQKYQSFELDARRR